MAKMAEAGVSDHDGVSQVTLTYSDGGTYTGGQNKDGKRHGIGRYVYPNGDAFHGSFENGKRYGKGTYTYESGGSYSGDWSGDCMHGQGTFTYRSGNCYSGGWRNDVPDGHGIFSDSGRVFDIEYKDGIEVFRRIKDTPPDTSGGGGSWWSALFTGCSGAGVCDGAREEENF